MDFLAIMEGRGKENNTYFIGVFIIENVEVRLIENGWKKKSWYCTPARVFMLSGNEYF